MEHDHINTGLPTICEPTPSLTLAVKDFFISNLSKIQSILDSLHKKLCPPKLSGVHLVIISDGWLVCGQLEDMGPWLLVHGLIAMEEWGGEHGIGGLLNGPIAGSTKFYRMGRTGIFPKSSVTFTIPVESPEGWGFTSVESETKPWYLENCKTSKIKGKGWQETDQSPGKKSK